MKKRSDSTEIIWHQFSKHEKLTDHQEQLFKAYVELLLDWNEKTNLTRITDLPDIISLHFQDSLRIRDFVDFTKRVGVCDVGTGAGFPGIPLKIMFPETPYVLLEVNTKKIAFLELVIETLGLPNCIVSPLDWRTFLRQAPYELDFFCARASLKPDELVRVFKPSCRYQDAQLVYWASKQWEAQGPELDYLIKQETYKVDNQQRVFAFFGNKKG